MNYILFTLIVLIVTISPISGKGNCSDSCTTTTQCLSTNGTSCYSDTLVTSTWSVSQSNNKDLVTLTLKANNVKQSESRSLSMAFKSSTYSLTNYTCSKSGTITVSVLQKGKKSSKTIQSGWASYAGDVLTCSWSFTQSDDTWPLYLDGGAQLLSDDRGILELRSGNKSAIVAYNVRDLPTYQLKYLKCCNKVHGNTGYLAIFNQTTDNSYLIRMMGISPNLVTLSLNSSSGMKLIFTCSFNTYQVTGLLANKTKSTEITNLMYKTYSVPFNSNPRCYWSHPLQLIGSYGQLDTVNELFDMQIVSDGQVVYTEKGVSLKNSGSSFVYNSLLLVLTMISMKLMIQ